VTAEIVNYPADVDLPYEPFDIPVGFGSLLSAAIEALPRPVIGEALNAELPPGSRMEVSIYTEAIGDPPRSSVTFDFSTPLIRLHGQVRWVEDGFRLYVAPEFSLPVVRP
jgi:hypothetical protein